MNVICVAVIRNIQSRIWFNYRNCCSCFTSIIVTAALLISNLISDMSIFINEDWKRRTFASGQFKLDQGSHLRGTNSPICIDGNQWTYLRHRVLTVESYQINKV